MDEGSGTVSNWLNLSLQARRTIGCVNLVESMTSFSREELFLSFLLFCFVLFFGPLFTDEWSGVCMLYIVDRNGTGISVDGEIGAWRLLH